MISTCLVTALALAAPLLQSDAVPTRRVSGAVLAGKAIERPAPTYPEMAKAAGVEGAVVVEVTCDEHGRVVKARAVSGHPLLRDAAVKAARNWLFEPTSFDGRPVRVVGTITFNLRIPPPVVDGPATPVSTETLYGRARAMPLPDYPADAARAGVEGMVQVRVTIADDGRIAEAVALSGDDALLEAAEKTAREWRFDAIRVDGVAVAATGDLYFLFEKGAAKGRAVLENGAEPESQAIAASGVAIPRAVEPRAPSSTERPEMLRVAARVLDSKAIVRQEPNYPTEAEEAGIEGSVAVEVIVDESGRVSSARAVSGHVLLREAALAAVRQWVFTPTELAGAPVKIVGVLTLEVRKR